MGLRLIIIKFFIIGISFVAAAQSETNCDNAVTISSAVNGSNVTTLYIGVGNRVSIKAEGIKPEDIVVKLSSGNGKLSPECFYIEGNNGFYIARVLCVGEVLLTVYSKENGAEKKLAERTLQTRTIPHPGTEEFKEVAKSLGLKGMTTQ